MTGDSEAIETVGAVLTDLAEVAGQLPVPAEQAEQVARILDRLSEEIAEAAALLRTAAGEAPTRPSLAVVHECPECGGVGTAPTHRRGCKLDGDAS